MQLQDPFAQERMRKFQAKGIMDELIRLRGLISEETHPFLKEADPVPEPIESDDVNTFDSAEAANNPEYFLDDLCDEDPSDSGEDADDVMDE